MIPGGTKRNLAYVAPFTSFDERLDDAQRLIVADAQTSGGLLLAVAPQHADALARALADQRVPVVAEIGEVTDDRSGRSVVER